MRANSRVTGYYVIATADGGGLISWHRSRARAEVAAQRWHTWTGLAYTVVNVATGAGWPTA